MDILSFSMWFHQERTWTTENIFRYFNVSTTDSIRTSGQFMATVLVLRKGPHLRAWLDMIKDVLAHDSNLFTDAYNDEARQAYPGFKDNRHDQSVSSVTRKLIGSIVIPDETYPPNQPLCRIV